MRRPPIRAKRDANEESIVNTLKAHGFSVYHMDKPLDLLVGHGGRTYLVEIKNGHSAPFTDSQKAFLKVWTGQVTILCDVADTDSFCKAVRANSMGRIPQIGAKP